MEQPDFTRQLSVLCCPRCGAGLGLRELPPENSIVACPTCHEAYPYRGGVLGLFYVDSTWFWPLNEILGFSDLSEKAIKGTLEEDRVEAQAYFAGAAVREIAEMAAASRKKFGEPRGRLMLEAGCGSCGQSKVLADAGFSVIALDVKVSELLAPRPRVTMPEQESFYAAYFRKDDVFKPEEIRFLRVAGDLLNLPIRDGSVEAAFTSAMLHHVQPLAPALVEMGRVLKPGGNWAASGEPASGLLQRDRMSSVYWTIECQEGFLEQHPPLGEYLRGFRRGGLDLESWDCLHAQLSIDIGSRRFRRLRLCWTGRDLSDHGRRHLPLWKLKWLNSGISFLLRRSPTHLSPRQFDPARERLAEAAWLFEPERYRSELHAALRRLVPPEHLTNPTVLGRLPHPEVNLRGFRLPERIEGRLVRFSTSAARIYLPRPPKEVRRVWIEYCVPPWQVASPLEGQVRVNDCLVGTITAERGGPNRSVFALPAKTSAARGAIEISLKMENLFRDPAGRRVGFAVERVWLE